MSQTTTTSMSTRPPRAHEEAESVRYVAALTKDYRERDAMKAFAAIFSNYVVIISCICATEIVVRMSLLHPGIGRTVYLLSVLIIASRLRAFENLVHEASHNNLFPSPNDHYRFQSLYAFPVFRDVEDYRRSHLVHHQYLGNRHKDPDIVRLFDLGLDKLPEKPGWYLIGLPTTGFLTYEYLTTTFWDFWKSSTSRSAKTIFWGSIILCIAYWNLHQSFLYYYIIPFLIILPVTRYWAEISEHLGLDLQQDLGSSRTNIGFLHRWYLNPHNDGYHAVHHLCSQVPFYLLPRVHTKLMEASGTFARKTVISHGVMETFHQMATARTLVKGTGS